MKPWRRGLALSAWVALWPAAGAAAEALEATRLAYVDPGAGSFVLQALVATLAGAVVAANAYWKKIRSFLGRPVPEADEDEKAAAARDDD